MLVINFSNFFRHKQKKMTNLYRKSLNGIFANISIFHLINLQVTSTIVLPLTAIDFMILHSFLSKSIKVFNFLFLNESPNFASTSLVSFHFFDFLSFFFQRFKFIEVFLIMLFYRDCFCRSKRIVMFYVSNLLLKILFNFLLQHIAI